MPPMHDEAVGILYKTNTFMFLDSSETIEKYEEDHEDINRDPAKGELTK